MNEKYFIQLKKIINFFTTLEPSTIGEEKLSDAQLQSCIQSSVLNSPSCSIITSQHSLQLSLARSRSSRSLAASVFSQTDKLPVKS